MTGSANLNRNVSLSETLFARSTCLRYCRYKYNFTISFTMLIESPSLSLEYYLFYELYFFSPRWRHRTHQLLIKARFGPILLFLSVEIQLAKK